MVAKATPKHQGRASVLASRASLYFHREAPRVEMSVPVVFSEFCVLTTFTYISPALTLSRYDLSFLQMRKWALDGECSSRAEVMQLHVIFSSLGFVTRMVYDKHFAFYDVHESFGVIYSVASKLMTSQGYLHYQDWFCRFTRRTVCNREGPGRAIGNTRM